MTSLSLLSGRTVTLASERKRYENKGRVQTTCDFQQCGILTSVDSGEPLQPPFKLNSK